MVYLFLFTYHLESKKSSFRFLLHSKHNQKTKFLQMEIVPRTGNHFHLLWTYSLRYTIRIDRIAVSFCSIFYNAWGDEYENK